MTAIFEAHGHVYTKCCATCKHWTVSRSCDSAVGICEHEDNVYFVEPSDVVRTILTLDLALCSRWEEKKTRNNG